MHTFSSESQWHWKEWNSCVPEARLTRESSQPPSLCTEPATHWLSMLVWLNHEGSTTFSLKRLFPGPYPEVSVNAFTISRFPPLPWWQQEGWGPSAQWRWVCPPLCLPDALLSLSLTILDGSLLPSIKLDWISIKKSNSFLSLSEALSEVSSKCNLLYKWEFLCDTCGSW